jgi:hypothetical protein
LTPSSGIYGNLCTSCYKRRIAYVLQENSI